MARADQTEETVGKRRTTATTFVCEAEPGTKRVFLAGDFNNWDPAETRMVRRNGAFRRRMHLPCGEYRYKFVVDGEWRADAGDADHSRQHCPPSAFLAL